MAVPLDDTVMSSAPQKQVLRRVGKEQLPGEQQPGESERHDMNDAHLEGSRSDLRDPISAVIITAFQLCVLSIVRNDSHHCFFVCWLAIVPVTSPH